jgi:hypothetical protein
MRNFIISIIILFPIFVFTSYAQSSDSQSVGSHYNQYSPKDISSPYSRTEVQYSPKNLNNPYNPIEVQYSSRNVSVPAQTSHDYHVGVVSGAAQGSNLQKVSASFRKRPAAGFLDNAGPRNSLPLFSILLVLTSLAVVLTLLVIIGVFRK